MIINNNSLLQKTPIKNMLTDKQRFDGVSHGLSEAGYDIRIKQDITFYPAQPKALKNLLKASSSNYLEDYWESNLMRAIKGWNVSIDPSGKIEEKHGNFTIASAIEEFTMPPDLVGVVHDKSTWARRGLSVFNTVIEPSWKGFLTLELVYHAQEPLHIKAGSGIAQVLFTKLSSDGEYNGKYQNQVDRPVEAIYEKG